eukprot:m.434769 g.434769  ORF g.434769 m.434769 type:complete len:526 (+) comp17764_c0_seq1:1329-2906(+)
MAGVGFKMDAAALNKKRSSLEGKGKVGENGKMAGDNAVQGEVFTKWVNMKLKEGNPKAQEIEPSQLGEAFRSGVLLTDLLQVVCEKKPGKIKREVRGKIQEIGNLNVVFTALQKEGVKLVNIGPEDIWDGNQNLILGFLWTLIYYFQVLKGANFGQFDAKALGAKVALLKWIQSKIPEMMVTNLDSDWQDGRALSALVNAISNDFKLGTPIDDPAGLSPDNAVTNLDKAMAVADDTLGIGRLVTPEQVAEAPNEKSMITYLSLYAAAKKPEKKKPKKKEPQPAAPPVVFFEAPTDPELLRKINALFDAMDVDGDNSLTKFELLEFLRECKPRDMSVSKVQGILGLDKLHEIDRKSFTAPFVDGKLDVDAFDISALSRARASKKAEEEAAAAAAAAEAEAKANPYGDALPPPHERAPDWRVYEGINLGGRCKIKIYFSTTTSSQKIRTDTQNMKSLMERHNYHLRPDFEHFTPVDIDMEKEHRDKIFKKAGTRVTPMLFVDDEFVGGYDQVAELDECGELDKIMQY